MHEFPKIFLIFLLVGAAASSNHQARAWGESFSIIDNVNILPMTGEGIQKGKAVIIKAGRIEEIISNQKVKDYPEAVIINGKGGFLIPGLIDSHVHYRTSEEFLNYIFYGVTTVLGLGQREKRVSEIKAKRGAIKKGETLGPKIYTTGQTISNHINFEEPEEAASYVNSLKEENLDFVKVYNNISKPIFDAVVAEAQKAEFAVFGHLPRNFSVEYALMNGLDVVTHAEEFYFTYFDGPRDQDLKKFKPSDIPDLALADHILSLMKINEVALIPNLIFTFEQMKFWDDTPSFMAEPEIKFLHPDLRNLWANYNSVSADRKNVQKRILRERIKYNFIHEFTRRAHEKGILLVTGTDAPIPGLYPGKSVHSEIREFVKVGLSYFEALATATANASAFVEKYVDRKARIGLIKTGYEADLVLIRENPLLDIRALDGIVGVMVDGVWHNREELEKLRAAMAENFPAPPGN